MLDLLAGRKLDALRAYAQQHPDFLNLNPKAVVMDLAQTYHTWLSECFPGALRIADRFHVHGCVIESVQAVRKSVQSTLFPRAKVILKSHHRLLNPPADSLPEKSRTQLDQLLAFSPLLREVWEWKEAFLTGMIIRQITMWPSLGLLVGVSRGKPLSTKRCKAP